MYDQMISRAQILMQQNRYQDAEKILNDVLKNNPENTTALYMLAEVNINQDKTTEAEKLIDLAIGIEPDYSHLFYIKAHIKLKQSNVLSAEQTIQEAINIDPQQAHYFSFWASIKLRQKKYSEALALADDSLALDAEDILGLNIRSTALIKLDRKEESYQTIEGALREDPNNSYTHANYGWNLLEKSQVKKALEHFKEALKNDPSNDSAKAGMLEALKANNFIYRWFLKYSFWIGNLTQNNQWVTIIGIYIIFRVIRYLADENESLQPFLYPLLGILALIAFSTWVITPISNLFLRFNPYGRHLLSKKEILSSNFVAVSVLVLIIGVLGYFLQVDEKYLALAAFGFSMMVPLSTMFLPTKYKNVLIIYAGFLFVVGFAALVEIFIRGEIFSVYIPIYFFGFIAFQWIANFMLIKQGNE
jgi:tetratricopeptide (TPR) repeat protein